MKFSIAKAEAINIVSYEALTNKYWQWIIKINARI